MIKLNMINILDFFIIWHFQNMIKKNYQWCVSEEQRATLVFCLGSIKEHKIYTFKQLYEKLQLQASFSIFYGFVKKLVQKNQHTYNFPPGSSANPYGKAQSAEFDGTSWTGWTGGRVGRSRKLSFKFLHTS